MEEHCIPGQLRATSGTSSDLSASLISTQNHRQLWGAWEGWTATHREQQVTHRQLCQIQDSGVRDKRYMGIRFSWGIKHMKVSSSPTPSASDCTAKQPRSDGVVSGTSKSSWKMCSIF